MTAKKKKQRPGSQPMQLRCSPEFLAGLDALREELIAAGHPVTEARGPSGYTRSDVLRLLAARGERVIRAELEQLRRGDA